MAGKTLTDVEWQVLQARTPGTWFFAVLTTGVVCRCGCAARPMRQNVRSYLSLPEALAQGFRACKRCKPKLTASSVKNSR